MNIRIFILISLFITLSNADYLNTKKNNICIYNVQPKQHDEGLCYTERSNDEDDCDSKLDYEDLINGYYYDSDDDACYLTNDLEVTGLTQNQWDYLLALLAHILGLTMLFLVNYTVILVVRSSS